MNLSKHFTLEEFTRSQTAARHGIANDPKPEHIDNMKRLCRIVLEPIREAAERPIYISSGYRCTRLNELIGGSETSAHRFGRAADFVIPTMTPFEVCEMIRDLNLVYDQLIHEFGRWVHIAIAPAGSTDRIQNLTAKHVDGETLYVPGIRRV